MKSHALRSLRYLLPLFTLSLPPHGASWASDWPISGGDAGSTRHTKLQQITPANVASLTPAWRFHLGFTHEISTVQGTPVFTGRQLVSASLNGDLIALAPGTGSELWRTRLSPPVGRRGLSFSATPEPTIYVPTGSGVTALDANTGTPIRHYASGESLLAPMVDRDRLFVATLWDGVHAFDRQSGEKIWQNPLKKVRLAPRLWAGMSYDPRLEMLYVVTSNPGGIVGTERPEEDYSSSLVALDAVTGDIRWHFQQIVHDLWDYELVGNPMLTDLSIDGRSQRVVIALSKTGEVILLRAEDGQPVFPGGFEEVAVEASEIPGELSSPTQKRFSKPEPFSPTVIRPESDFAHLDPANRDYVDLKLRHSRAGFFIPPSVHFDTIIYGVHGGAEWPGGAISHGPGSTGLVIPFNRDPWILRVYHEDGLHAMAQKLARHLLTLNHRLGDLLGLQAAVEGDPLPANGDGNNQQVLPRWARGDDAARLARKIQDHNPLRPEQPFYLEQCAQCHGRHREGAYQTENEGDLLYPPLVGLTMSKKAASYGTARQLRELHAAFDISLQVSESEYEKMLQEFSRYDRLLERIGMLKYKGLWQYLIDRDGFPATTPPWGGIAKIDLNTGRKVWTLHHGRRVAADGRLVAEGDMNFGGVITTASGLIFATGTVEPKAFAFSDQQGDLLWQAELPYSGSAPPMTYEFGGCQYVVFVATGGQYVGYGEKGDAIQAFRLDSCKPSAESKTG